MEVKTQLSQNYISFLSTLATERRNHELYVTVEGQTIPSCSEPIFLGVKLMAYRTYTFKDTWSLNTFRTSSWGVAIESPRSRIFALVHFITVY